MQAVILAAGKSSRFVPFTDISHKSMVKIMGKPILEHTLLSLKNGGVSEVVIVVGENSTIPQEIDEEKNVGLKIHYVTHIGAKGMGAALLDAKEYLQESFFLLNAYHLEFDVFVKGMLSKQRNENIVLLTKKPQESTQFGVVEINGDKVVGVEEKPKKVLDNHLQIIGIYLLSKKFLHYLENTPLDHYHFEKALDNFAKKEEVTFFLTKESTISLKYAWDLLSIKDYLFGKMLSVISPSAHISKTAQISGNVVVGDNAKIMEGAVIKGPVYIGKNVTIGNYVVLRSGVDVEENAVIGARMEVKNSIIFPGVTTHSGFLGDSIVGSYTKIAAYFCSANARLDRENVTTIVKDEKVNSGLRHLGVIVGDKANIGIRVSTMPGNIIGSESMIGPSTTVMKNVPPSVKYYTRFSEIKEDAK